MTKQARIIRWETPPPPARGDGGRGGAGEPRSRYNTVADQLRARPGEWGVIEEFPGRVTRGLASKIISGAMVCFRPAGDFEATTRRAMGVTAVYARYLGDGEASDA